MKKGAGEFLMLLIIGAFGAVVFAMMCGLTAPLAGN